MKLFSSSLLALAACACASSEKILDRVIEKYGDSRHGWHQSHGAMKESPVKADERSLQNGSLLFQANCAPCHGEKGQGDGPFAKRLNTRPSDLNQMRGDGSDYHIFLQISLGDGDMPDRAQLSDRDKWDIVNFIQTTIKKTSPDGSL